MDRIFKDHLSPWEPTIVASLDVSFAVDESFEAVESFVAADDSFMSLSASPVDEGARLTPYTVFPDGPACEVPTTLSGIVTV